MENVSKYRCVCGKEFENSQAFNGHKSHCKVHQLNKYGNLDKLNENIRNQAQKSSIILGERAKVVKQKESVLWVSEQHTCEKCGKVMTEKYGSGRFCCRQCANSRHHSEETRRKMSVSAYSEKPLEAANKIKQSNRQAYYLRPNKCVVCGVDLPYEMKRKKTCSQECYAILRRNIRIKTMEQAGNNAHRYYFGFYHNIECDSSWELAFLIYNLENDVDIHRCTQSFDYVDENKRKRKYFPDFIINGDYYEIKGQYTEQVKCKIRDFPKSLKLEVLDQKKIQPYIDYCVEKYGKEYYELYDDDKPSWKDHRQIK